MQEEKLLFEHDAAYNWAAEKTADHLSEISTERMPENATAKTLKMLTTNANKETQQNC